MAKPFGSEELVARIRVLLRRTETILKLGNVALNSHDRTMKIGDQEIPLPNKEFVLLRTLIRNPRKIFSKVFLYEKVWEMSADVESNAIETMVNKLRRRLNEAGATVQIKNSRNAGYWIEE
ncbi:Heme response regulator HssR [compost metagenome]